MADEGITPPRRIRPPESGPESEMLCGMLDFLRATAVVKVVGLTDEQAFTRAVTPSALTAAGLVAGYEQECARSRATIAGAGLDDLARGEGMTFTLRYALAHMIEETARHCGHLDLLREGLDGSTGM